MARPNLQRIYQRGTIDVFKGHVYEAHLDREQQTLNEILNVEMDELADTVHFDPLWKARSAAQIFKSVIVEIII